MERMLAFRNPDADTLICLLVDGDELEECWDDVSDNDLFNWPEEFTAEPLSSRVVTTDGPCLLVWEGDGVTFKGVWRQPTPDEFHRLQGQLNPFT